jgi:hypothetical protein
VKFCFLRRGFVHSGCVCWTERGTDTETHFCVTCLGRRGEVWSIPDVDAGWPERQMLFVAMIVVCWMETRNNGARAVVLP